MGGSRGGTGVRIPSSTKTTTTTHFVKFGPPLTKLSGSAHGGDSIGTYNNVVHSNVHYQTKKTITIGILDWMQKNEKKCHVLTQ